VQAKLRETLSVTDYGAVPDIASDQTTSFVNAVAAVTAVGEISLPEGNYVVDLATIRTAVGTKLIMWTGPGKINGAQTKQLPGLNFDLTGERLTIRNDPNLSSPSDFANFEITRQVSHSDSVDALSSALRVHTIVAATAGALASPVTREWAINGVIDNSSPEMHAVATSGVATANDEGPIWALHGNAIDLHTSRAVNVVRSAELNIQASDADTNSKRIILDILSKSNAGAVSPGVGAGIVINAEGGDITNGIEFKEVTGSYLNACIRVNASPANALIQHQSGTAAYGLLLRGTYSTAAISLPDDAEFAWRSNSTITSHYNTTSGRLRFDLSGSERVGFEIDPTPSVYLNGTQVVGLQQSAIANPASSTAGNNAAIISILGALRAHGLIAT
jgi:hypothetical protein